MTAPTIGVLGANGQVATEVCLHLSRRDDVRVVPICRSELSAAFLRRCGLECRIGSFTSPEEARDVLAGCDLVVDCTMPAGTASRIRAAITSLVTSAVEGAPQGARYVYVSSIMALGMGPEDRRFVEPWLAGTIYGATKRYGEKLVRSCGMRVGREVYALRLGEVHGEIQAVSRTIRSRVRPGESWVPDGPSYAVFTFTVAEALAQIALGRERPGVYTLVSQPEWSYAELYGFWCRRAGVEPLIALEPAAATGRLGRARAALRRWLVEPIARFAVAQRERAGGYLLVHAPALEQRVVARFHTRNARNAIEAELGSRRHRVFPKQFAGRAPGARLAHLSDSRSAMEPAASEVARLLAVAGPGQRAPSP